MQSVKRKFLIGAGTSTVLEEKATVVRFDPIEAMVIGGGRACTRCLGVLGVDYDLIGQTITVEFVNQDPNWKPLNGSDARVSLNSDPVERVLQVELIEQKEGHVATVLRLDATPQMCNPCRKNSDAEAAKRKAANEQS